MCFLDAYWLIKNKNKIETKQAFKNVPAAPILQVIEYRISSLTLFQQEYALLRYSFQWHWQYWQYNWPKKFWISC